jgi:hypothetical protein
MTTMRAGTLSRARAPVESRMRFWSVLKPGISNGREPVARITFLAIRVCSPLAVCTITRWPSGPDLPSRAAPSTMSTPLPLSKVRTPPVSC